MNQEEGTNTKIENNETLMQDWYKLDKRATTFTIIGLWALFIASAIFIIGSILNHGIDDNNLKLDIAISLSGVAICSLGFNYDMKKRKIILKYDFKLASSDIIHPEEITNFTYSTYVGRPTVFQTKDYYQKAVYPDYIVKEAEVTLTENKQVFTEEILLFIKNPSASTLKLYRARNLGGVQQLY